MNFDHAITLGFDLSEPNGRYVRVRCSQCQAMCINGTPCHERGCPNAMHECRGCNAIVPVRQRYCEDCQ